MIQIVPCPRCRHSLVLPAAVSVQATLACPQCRHEFVLHEMLEKEFGTWEIVEDPGRLTPAEIEAAGNAASEWGDPSPDAAYLSDASRAGTGVAKAMGGLVAEEEKHASLLGAGELKLQDASRSLAKPSASQQPAVEPITHEQFERIKRKSRSPIWSVLQVILGGFAAIPIALLILWHLLDRDVAGAGPKVAAYLPWIVPEKFHPMESQGRQRQDSLPPRKGASGFRQFDDIMPPPQTTEGSVDLSSAAADASPDSLTRMPGLENAVVSSKDSASDGADLTEPGLPPSPQERNILLLIEQCKQDLDAWNAANRSSNSTTDVKMLRKLAQQLYQDLTDLSLVISDLPEGTPVVRAIRDAMQPIGRMVKRQPDVQTVVEQGARHWLSKYAGQSALALAVILEIHDVTETSAGWEIVPSDPQAVVSARVFVPGYLAPSLIPGQRLLLLGMLRHNESANSDEAEPVAEQPARSAPNSRVFEASYLHGL